MMPLVRGLTVAILFLVGLSCLVVSVVGAWAAWSFGTARPAPLLVISLLLGLGCLNLALRLLTQTDPLRIRDTLATAALASLTAVVCLAGLEIALRSLSPAMTYERAKSRSPAIFAPSDFVPFVLKAGYRGPTLVPETGEMVELTINSLGYRGPEFSLRKPVGAYRILVLGDSFAANIAVSDEELYTTVLERELNGDPRVRCPVEVINAGWADGFSPEAYAAYMLQRGFALEPDLVLMQYFVLNDFKDLLENEVIDWRGDLPLRVRSKARYIDEEGRLRRSFVARYRVPVLRNSHVFNHLWVLFALEGPSLEVARLLFSDFSIDNFYYGADGIQRMDAYAPESERPPLLQHAFERSLNYVAALQAETTRRGADFVLFLVPTGVQTAPESWKAFFGTRTPGNWDAPNPQAQIKRRLMSEGVPIFDPLGLYREGVKTRALYLGKEGNGHWNAEGNLFTARILRDFLLGEHEPFRTACLAEEAVSDEPAGMVAR